MSSQEKNQTKEQKLEEKRKKEEQREEARKKKEQLRLERGKKAKMNACKANVNFLCRGSSLWVFLCIMLIMVICAGVYAVLQKTPDWIVKDNTFTIMGFSVLGVFFFISIAKIISCRAIRSRVRSCGLGCLKNMPEKPDHALQETYIGLHCRKCLNHWISFGLGSLCIVAVLYTILICVGDLIAKGSTDAAYNLFKTRTFNEFSWKKFGELPSGKSEDWSTKLCALSFVALLIVMIHYAIIRSSLQKKIRVMEEFYGKDKLANDCLLSYRVNIVNRRYKIVVFSLVCTVGCLVYFLFKRVICTVFDKSFGL